MSHPWSDLKWWNSGERQVVEEKIDDIVAEAKAKGLDPGSQLLPGKASMYKALQRTPERTVRVCIVGQDPYPTPGMATGTAFEVDDKVQRSAFPPTFNIILNEYVEDLHFPSPDNGSLRRWTDQGVLLWNAIPVCKVSAPLSCDWPEWEELNREIIERLSEKGVVFVFLGNVARRYEKYVTGERNKIICTSHPSPRGIRFGKTPFAGSRIFSTINVRLREIGQEPIDWRLTDVPPGKSEVSGPDVARGKVLPNVTGAILGGLKAAGTSPNIYTSLVF